MHTRLYSQRVRALTIALVVGLAAIISLAALPSAAHAQFGSISGNVSGPDGGIDNATVTAFPAGGGGPVSQDASDFSGDYKIISPPLSPGSYKIEFDAPGYVSEYYDDSADFAGATPITVTSGDVPGIDATLTPQARISGTVTDSLGQPVAGVCVTAEPDGGGVVPPTVQTDVDGNYTVIDLLAGTYHVQFDPCDSPANVLGEWYNDKPSAATADDITLNTGDDRTGVDAQLATGGSISGTVLTSEGQPAAGAQVNVRTALGVLESAIVDTGGAYTVGQLPSGSYKVEFLPPAGSLDLPEFWQDSPDEAGATLVPVTAGVDSPGITATFNADTVPPVVTIDSGPGLTNDSQPSWTFSTEADATVECSIDTGTASYGPCSDAPTGHTAPSALTDGDYTFRVKATDPSGNPTEVTRSFTVDTEPPGINITGGPSGPTGFTTPTFSFSTDYEESTPTIDCAIDPAGDTNFDWGPCSSASSHTPSTPLADGDYVFRVRATDAATNSAVVQRAFTVDSDGPNISITGGPAGPTNDATPTHAFSASQNAILECAIDPAGDTNFDWGACSSATSNTSPTLADGSYVFRVRATDDAAHTNVDQRTFTVDTVAPALSITGGPTGPTNDSTPSFGFNAEAGATVECAVDPAGDTNFDWGTCSSAGGHTPSALADGGYVFRVRATDAATNTATDQRSFTVDTGITLTITGGPTGPTNDSTPTFDFSTEAGATVECSIDTGTPSFGSCSGAATHTPAALANAAYTFRVRATDGANNSTTATQGFSVDTLPPSVSITGGPAGETTEAQPTFTFNAEPGATVQCSLDTGTPAFGSCSSGSSHTPAAPLGDGSYTFRVRATDAASNAATATRSFDLDAPDAPPPPAENPPTVKITGGPKAKTKDKTPTFKFESNDTFATFKCKVDGRAAFDCKSPATLKKLKPGKHTFSVTAISRSGLTSAPASQSFKVKKKKKKK